MKRLLSAVASVSLVVAISLDGSLPSFSANATISGSNSATYLEGSTSIAPFTSVSVGGGPFDGSYVDFEVVDSSGSSISGGADTDALDDLSLSTSGSISNTSGVVTVSGGTVYVGKGSSAEAVGQVDGTFNGQNGTKLRVNFSTTFENSGFESGAVTPWTVLGQQIDMGSTQILGYTTPADSTVNYPGADRCSGQGQNDNDTPDSASYSGVITTAEKNSGSYSLRLLSSGMDTRYGGDVVHGPAAYSVEFDGTQGQSLSFYWKAADGGDNFHIWGGLLATDASLPGGGQRWTELLDPGTGTVTNWAQASGTIPHTGKFRFVFISGTHDYSCGEVAGASLYIDDVVITGSSATASVVGQLAPFVRYSSEDDSPPATRYIRMNAVPSSGLAANTTATITVTPVNDAPSIDGDGSTTTVARTLVETDLSSVDSPLANLTGTLSGYDPDLDSPTYTYGISGGSVSGSEVTKAGTYGSLYVNPSTGAYRYVPNMAAIKPLNTGSDPVDSFSLTVSDGALTGSGTLAVTIDSITDTEPAPVTITGVIGGNGFLTVLYDMPNPAPVNAITNFQYSTDGTNFRALSPAVASGPIQISTLSSDGTTALANGTSYTITLKAVNTGGTSDASNSLAGAPSSTPRINSPSIQSFEPSTSLTEISEDFEVSGFGPTQTLLVTIGLTGAGANTQFALSNFEDSGASEGSGYASYTDDTAVNDFAITGTQSEVNYALKGLKIKTGTARSNFSVNVSASVVSGNILQSGSTQSFYEFVNTSGISWDAAKTAAENRTYAGVLGYLVTITSAEENAFVASRIPGASNVWIGASDATTEGDWRWVTGPEGANGGTRFWYSTSGVVNGVSRTSSYSPPTQSRACTATGSTPLGSVDANLVTYACWSSGEPNNSDGSRGEDAVVTNWSGVPGKWNDLAGANTGQISGYVVEYSEWNGQTFSASSVVKTSSSVSMGGPALTATAGTLSASLSWTAPTRTGQTVASYSVSSVPTVSGATTCSGTATSCVVSGLTAGTSYAFTVTATWSDAATSTSNSATITATAASSGGGGGGGGGTVIIPLAQPQNPQGPRLLDVLNRGPVQAPVFQNNQVPTPPNAPTAIVNGVPTQLSTLVTDPNNLNIRTGVLNIGINVQQNEGLVRQGTNGETEVQIRKGGVTGFQGAGLAPNTFVQVFLPLQGNNSKELARIPVDETGAFNGEAVFQTGLQDAPLPIGRQVLQMVTVDERGRQTVVEIAVNIVQPAPAPEINRENGQTPQLLPGQSLATNGGVPEVVQVSVIPDEKQTIIEGDGWTMGIAPDSQRSNVTETEDGNVLLELVRDESATVSGSGFMPGTRADVWLFSEPTLLGTVEIDENGEFNGTVTIDGQMIAVGEHTLQMQGVGEDGYVRAANLGVMVNDEDTASSTEDAASGFLWWLLGGLAALGLATAATLWWRRRTA